MGIQNCCTPINLHIHFNAISTSTFVDSVRKVRQDSETNTPLKTSLQNCVDTSDFKTLSSTFIFFQYYLGSPSGMRKTQLDQTLL